MFNASSAMRRLYKAREQVASRHEWFGGLIYTARLQEKPIGTMATDGLNIFADPDFVKEADAHIEGIFLHEILHCALDHVKRRQWREHGLWNISCDYAINPIVKRYFSLPGEEINSKSAPDAKGHLFDRRFVGMRAERIYDILEKEREKGKTKGDEPGNNPQPGEPDDNVTSQGDGDGDSQDQNQGEDNNETGEQSGRMEEPTPEEIEKNSEEWKRVAGRSTAKCKEAGTMPSEIERAITELLPSEKLDWRKLADDMARNSRENVSTSWSRPNRRWIGQDVIMPGYDTTKCHTGIVCFDCSGSINDQWINEMKAECCNLLEQKLFTKLILIATDTRICNEAEVSEPDEVRDFVVRSGGGTNFDECMQRVGEIVQSEDVAGCIFLTDMQTSSFGADPGVPMVWVDWTKDGTQKAPFGKVCAL